LNSNKKTIRETMLNKRGQLSNDEIIVKSNSIAKHLYNTTYYNNSNFIMTYINFRKEVITKGIIQNSLKKGKDIGVPITVPKSRKLIVSQLKDFEKELKLGFYNILTPKKEYIREVEPSSIDLVLVPGAGFDKRGYRIGYGGGYYDTFFTTLNKDAIKIGLAFQMQIMDKVPNEDHDIPVNFIITENGLIKCYNV